MRSMLRRGHPLARRSGTRSPSWSIVPSLLVLAWTAGFLYAMSRAPTHPTLVAFGLFELAIVGAYAAGVAEPFERPEPSGESDEP